MIYSISLVTFAYAGILLVVYETKEQQRKSQYISISLVTLALVFLLVVYETKDIKVSRDAVAATPTVEYCHLHVEA